MGLGNLLNLYRIKKLYELIRKGLKHPALLEEKKYWLELLKTASTIKEVKEIMGWLQGYKTYIIAILTAILTFLHAMGYIDDALYQTLLALLGSGAIATVAAKIGKVQSDINNKVSVNKK